MVEFRGHMCRIPGNQRAPADKEPIVDGMSPELRGTGTTRLASPSSGRRRRYPCMRRMWVSAATSEAPSGVMGLDLQGHPIRIAAIDSSMRANNPPSPKD